MMAIAGLEQRKITVQARRGKLAALSRASDEFPPEHRAAEKERDDPRRDDVDFPRRGNSFNAAKVNTPLTDYQYDLPRELIAQRPLVNREHARMMVLRRTEETLEHSRFLDLPRFLCPGDLLVLNDSRVLPARHFSDDGALEFLFLQRLDANHWRALVKPARNFPPGARRSIKGVSVEAGEVLTDGAREVIAETDADFQRGGAMPLPPYITRPSDLDDVTRYQTVFAARDGSVAAPTAG